MVMLVPNPARRPVFKMTHVQNVRNVYTLHTKGLIAVAGSQFTSTFHALAHAPCTEFTHVRVIFKNKEASPPNITKCIIGVTNTATTFAEKSVPSPGNTITEDGSTGWVSVKFSGSDTVALPAANSSITGDHGTLFSDWMPINSLVPIDGSPWPYIMCRVKMDANFTFWTPTVNIPLNTQQNYFESFRQAGTDAATTPSNFNTPTANDPNSIIFGFQFRSSTAVMPILFCGDSITQGLHSSATSDSVDPTTRSWVPIAYESLLALGYPVNCINYGYSGGTTTTYAATGKKAIVDYKPGVVFYSVYSPNDGTPTQALVDAMYARAMDFAGVAMENGAIPVFTFLAPNENITAAADVFRLSLINRVKQTGFLVVDITQVLGDNRTPQKFNPQYRTDTLHPNLAGYTAAAVPIVQTVINLFKRLGPLD